MLLVGPTGWVEDIATAFEARTEATVQTVDTAEDAIRILHSQSIDCVITEYELDDSTGLQLLRSIREETETLPVLVCTAAGSEAIASEAVSAGATDYLALSELPREHVDEIVASAEKSIRFARETAIRRDRARQFDAFFRDTRTAKWVLDPDGSLTRANQTASGMIDQDVESTGGQPFWTLPWWSQTSGLEGDIRQIIEGTTDGEFRNAIVTRSLSPDNSQVVELSTYPVHDERGNVVSIVVTGDDITEQREQKREWRTIIHRVTDAVVEVDEDWYFTFVDDRAEEIYETDADALLGEYFWDVFDGALGTRFEEVYSEVMETREPATLVEYNTDLDGWFHVEIYPTSSGGLAFYFQDITDRKRYENRIAGLNDALGEFMQAKSKQEVSDIVIGAAEETLDFPVTAIALYDNQDGALHLTAQTAAAEGLLDTTSLFGVGDSVGWEAFVENDIRRIREPLGDTSPAAKSPDADLATFPLGNHGILLTGSTSADGLTSADIEFAQAVAANTSTAFDRMDREQQLKERETILQEKNKTLERLSRVNDIIRSLDQALVRASSRPEIEEVVCEQLAGSGPYKLAWIGEHDGVTQEVTPTEWAGAEKGYLGGVTVTTTGEPESQGPIGQAVSTGEPQVVNDILHDHQYEPRRQGALNRGYHAAISLPLRYEGSLYGVLNVYSSQPGVFTDLERVVLTELADTIAYAINAVESKKAIVSDEVTRLEFDIVDANLEIVEMARELGCEVTLESLVAQTDGGHRAIVSTRGVPVDAILEFAPRLAVTDLSLLSESSTDGEPVGLFEAWLDENSLIATVLEHGGRPVRVSVEGGKANVTIELAADAEIREFVEMFQAKYPNSTLTAKQSFQRPRQTSQEFKASVIEELTVRQFEVLKAAYFNDYFEQPRTLTAGEIAETLDISQPTFTGHLRAAERKIFGNLFEEEPLSA